MRVDIDRHGINSLDRERELWHPMLEYAKKAAREAKRLAPVESGHYRESIHAAYVPSPTAMAIYGATDFKSWWVEFGTRRGIPRRIHILAKAGRNVGLSVDDVAIVVRKPVKRP